MTKKHTLTEAEKAMLAALLSDVRPVAAKSRAPDKKPLVKRKPLPVLGYRLTTTLDLHGMTVAVAHSKLSAFMVEHYQAGSRNLLVITGKSGELARDVPRWLSLTDLARMVSSVAHASPRQGGEGALVVKLKRK